MRSLVVPCCVVLLPLLVLADDGRSPESRRKPWTTSRITGSPEPPPPYVTERVRPNLAFDQPVEMVVAPGEDRPYVVERKGRILRLPADPDAGMEDLEVVLDGAGSIEGLTAAYGLAFHPDYARNRTLFICYILKPQLPEGTRVSRFTMTAATDDAPARIDPMSETILLEWRSGGHNGGSLKFGNDGYLYVTTGDASPPAPPDEHDTGQDLTDLEASVLRIDVDNTDGDRPYAIPEDNPFVDLDGARPEIWAYGFRNPWRMSVDRTTGDLWLGDVGWQLWEMVYRVERGGNYGWSVKEGPQSVRPEATHGPTPILPPTKAHPRVEAASVTGGFVYRGKRLPDLAGRYVYGDYVTGKIWALAHDDGRTTDVRELTDTPLAIICFFEDHDGEIALLDYNAGTIHRLVPNPAAGRKTDFPTKLSETGLFRDVSEHQTAEGVYWYRVNVPRWMDGAIGQRYVAIPDGGTMTLREPTERVPKNWGEFPEGTVLAKTIMMGAGGDMRRMETQILHFTTEDWRGNGGEWRGYSYVWNEAQSEATLAPAEGVELDVLVGGERVKWQVSSRTECYACHNPWAGYRLGFTIPQLNVRIPDAPDTPGTPLDRPDQLESFIAHGLIELDLGDVAPTDTENLPRLFPTHSENPGPLERRARSYLHANCAHCHRFGGGGTANILLDYKIPNPNTNMIAVRPTQGTFGISRAEIVAPGDPLGSVLMYRMSTLGRGRMPHVGSREIDRDGLRVVREWIATMHRDTEKHGPRATAEIASVLASIQDLQPSTSARDREAAVDRLFGSTRGALALATGLPIRTPLDPSEQSPIHEIVRRGRESGPEISGLFEPFVRPTLRTKRLGTRVDVAELLALNGNAETGEQLFHHTTGIQCRSCHRVGDEGGRIGPELTTIARIRDRHRLLESILEPSKTIEPKWRTHVLETKGGRVHTGLLVERTDEHVVLRPANPEEKEVTVPAADVEQLVPTDRSLMPDLLFRDMTAQQLADLLAYLESLR